MTEEEALLAAICRGPEEGPRLVYGFATQSAEIDLIRCNWRFRRGKSLIPKDCTGRQGPIALQTAIALQSRADGLAALLASPHLRKLERLDLSFCPLGIEGAGVLAASTHLRGLTELTVDGSSLTRKTRARLLQRFGPWVTLEDIPF
jgi:hypothetical protein